MTRRTGKKIAFGHFVHAKIAKLMLMPVVRSMTSGNVSCCVTPVLDSHFQCFTGTRLDIKPASLLPPSNSDQSFPLFHFTPLPT